MVEIAKKILRKINEKSLTNLNPSPSAVLCKPRHNLNPSCLLHQTLKNRIKFEEEKDAHAEASCARRMKLIYFIGITL